jgi:uncharacterized metal-binding protein YceD (DUF177 family)
MVSQSAEPEFVRPVAPKEIGPDGLDMKIEADPDERERLTKRFELLSLDRLVAQLHLRVAPTGISVRVSGRFQARFAQECIVSLEPVVLDVDEALEAEFGPAAAETEILVSIEGPEPTEPLHDGRIDLGELVAQNLAVALEPYPRKSDAELPEWTETTEKTGQYARERPFSVLAALRKNDE